MSGVQFGGTGVPSNVVQDQEFWSLQANNTKDRNIKMIKTILFIGLFSLIEVRGLS